MSNSQLTLTPGQGLHTQILSFLRNLEDLRDFIDIVSGHLDDIRKEEFDKDPDALVSHLLLWNEQYPEGNFLTKEQEELVKSRVGDQVEIVETIGDNGEKKYELRAKGEFGKRVHDASKRIHASLRRSMNLNNSALISLTSACELFAGQLLHYYFIKFPQAASLKEKNFSYEELLSFSTIEDARKYLVDNKVEEILRANFMDWMSFFSEKIKISTDLIKDNFPYCQEACLRRNLLVHNGGVVNSVHMKKLPVELVDRPRIGQRLAVKEEYFSDRLDRFEVVFLVLALEVWKKFSKEDEGRGQAALEFGYNALSRKRWSVARILCKHVMDEPRFAEDLRMYAQVNYWQSYKWAGDFESVRADVEAWDVSAKNINFQAAKAALLDQDDAAVDLLKKLLKRDELSIDNLLEWPLFNGLRERNALSELIASQQGEDEADSSKPQVAISIGNLELSGG